jgi:hypothetical protein
MTAATHPPYGVPKLGSVTQFAQAGRDVYGLYNIRLDEPSQGAFIWPRLTASFCDSHYGPSGGVQISISKREPYGIRYVSVGDKEAVLILNDEPDVDALGLWDIGDSLIDIIPDAIEHLADMYDEILDTIKEAVQQGFDYAVERLNTTAQRRTKQPIRRRAEDHQGD